MHTKTILKISIVSFIDQQTFLTKRATLLNALTRKATVLKDPKCIYKILEKQP